MTEKDISGIAAAKRPRGRPKTQSDDERRRAILVAAQRTFTEFGYLGTTMDMVARRCRVSKQMLYKLFPSKVDLFLGSVVAHRRRMLDLPRPPEEDEAVAVALEAIFMIDIDDEAEKERSGFVEVVMRDSASLPEIAEILKREGIDRSRQDLAEWLKLQAGRGKLVLEDFEGGAQMLMDMVFGATGPAGRHWKTTQQKREHIRACLQIFARGTAPAHETA